MWKDRNVWFFFKMYQNLDPTWSNQVNSDALQQRKRIFTRRVSKTFRCHCAVPRFWSDSFDTKHHPTSISLGQASYTLVSQEDLRILKNPKIYPKDIPMMMDNHTPWSIPCTLALLGPWCQLPALAESLHPCASLLLGSASAWAWEPSRHGVNVSPFSWSMLRKEG